MIECEICNIYFHADEIQQCPKCGIELCEKHYQTHVKNCLLSSDDKDEDN